MEGLLQHHSPPGPPRELTPSIRQALEQKLSDPNGWRSYGELKAWLQQEVGMVSSYSSVYRWVGKKLQAQPKVPQRRAQQASERQQQQFQKNFHAC
ncbi:MAG: hypothetical protein BRC49_02785 [Cyanobacteria bacterium SW_10_48_33]|nr:MAG: hypothetical protein BRC46_12570 [Cyanobacteria bacterium QS_6_48_18]PSP13260.1 MAG: hypothetical protein BRC49_02785 [Cyanobacteria bacterium SW_10_48_33]PSP20962.1 MAG: hypothetical protein BRC52_07545 [Cyanobacteria bacterium SW_5_48_44]